VKTQTHNPPTLSLLLSSFHSSLIETKERKTQGLSPLNLNSELSSQLRTVMIRTHSRTRIHCSQAYTLTLALIQVMHVVTHAHSPNSHSGLSFVSPSLTLSLFLPFISPPSPLTLTHSHCATAHHSHTCIHTLVQGMSVHSSGHQHIFICYVHFCPPRIRYLGLFCCGRYSLLPSHFHFLAA
jgi:hypothetical protein